MKKLNLTLDTLRVETFSIGGGKAEEGTVLAHSGGNTTDTKDITCEPTGPALGTCCHFPC